MCTNDISLLARLDQASLVYPTHVQLYTHFQTYIFWGVALQKFCLLEREIRAYREGKVERQRTTQLQVTPYVVGSEGLIAREVHTEWKRVERGEYWSPNGGSHARRPTTPTPTPGCNLTCRVLVALPVCLPACLPVNPTMGIPTMLVTERPKNPLPYLASPAVLMSF